MTYVPTTLTSGVELPLGAGATLLAGVSVSVVVVGAVGVSVSVAGAVAAGVGREKFGGTVIVRPVCWVVLFVESVVDVDVDVEEVLVGSAP
jgi:hypothetical protein